MNIGVRPTFSGERLQIEAHFLGCEGIDCYGQRVTLTFQSFIREEQKFDGVLAQKERLRKRMEGITSEG